MKGPNLLAILDDLRDLIQTTENLREAAFEAGYKAGFDASGIGWNAEYPFHHPGPNYRQTERLRTECHCATQRYLAQFYRGPEEQG